MKNPLFFISRSSTGDFQTINKGRGFVECSKLEKCYGHASPKKKKFRTIKFCEKYWSGSIHNFQAPPHIKTK
jgi:hypothetical protein